MENIQMIWDKLGLMNYQSFAIFLMSLGFINYFFIRNVIYEIFIGSLPGSLKSARRMAEKTKSSQPFLSQVSQSYVRPHVISKFKFDYWFYMALKWVQTVLVLIVGPISLMVYSNRPDLCADNILCKIAIIYTFAASLFSLTSRDTSHMTKYTRCKIYK